MAMKRCLPALLAGLVSVACGPARPGGDGGSSSSGGGSGPSSSGQGGSSSSGGASPASSSGAAASSGGDTVCVQWDFNGNFSPWTLDNAMNANTLQPAGAVTLLATGNDPFMSVTTSFDAARCTIVEVDWTLTPQASGQQSQLFFARAGDPGFAEGRSRFFAVPATPTLARLDMTTDASWNGTMTRLRLDPFGSPGTVTLRHVRVLQHGGGPASSSASGPRPSSSAARSSSSATSAGNTNATWSPTTATEACTQFRASTAVNTPSAFTAGAAQCDLGTVNHGAIDDAVRRINLYRAMVGEGPVTDDADLNLTDQYCAVTSAWNPAGSQAHHPPTTSVCYTAQAAQGAGMSNIAWGPGHPADGIDQFIQDSGNAQTMGHRRWILYPPLNPVGMGFYVGGNQYGSAMCLAVFSGGNTGPRPEWYAFPPPGFVPMQIAQWPWTFHTSRYALNGAAISVVREDDGATLTTSLTSLWGGYGDDATTLTPSGWAVEAGKSYRVTLTPTGQSPITYTVKPVNCL